MLYADRRQQKKKKKVNTRLEKQYFSCNGYKTFTV